MASRRRPGAAAAPSFDPLAIVAIIVSLFFAPVGLLMAISSLSRARKTGVSPALSVVALVVGIVAMAVFVGAGSLLSLLAG